MVVNQGDIFLVDLPGPLDSEPGYRRPCVVIQNNLFNRSRIKTVVVCMLTSNLKRANAPGNLLLEKKETGLSKQSVVNVSQLYTINQFQLTEYVGTLSENRLRSVLSGVWFLLDPREIDA